MKATGQVIGTAGYGLSGDTSWAANDAVARVGLSGEIRTAEILNKLARERGGPTVMHDLTFPGTRANIDHLVISGDRVLIIDSKVWKPGVYWTLGGQSRRGTERVRHLEKDSIEKATARLKARLTKAKIKHVVVTPIVVVWPSRRGGVVRTSMLRVPGAKVIAADKLEAYVRRFTKASGSGYIAGNLRSMIPQASQHANMTDTW